MKKEKHYKLGIISYNIHTMNNNFGAMLHSWAFQKYLDKFGISSVIIDYKNFKYRDNYKNIDNIFKYPKKSSIKILRILFALYKKLLIKIFILKNCTVTKNTYYKDEIQYYNDSDAFCCETDVTWSGGKNGYNRGFMCDYDNMKGKNNIAYSVDFGSGEISAENIIKLKEYAKNFKNVSFRNVFKIDYIKNLINRPEACITVDPTLLLDEKDYLPITKDIKLKDYVLVYNCKENHPEMVKLAKEFARANNLKIKIINCYNINIGNSSGIPTPISIESFLGYIKNSKYFFTNSYHGICFSIIFKKNFFAFSRKANNEKILTMLKIAGLENRYINSDILPTEIINYETIYKNIEPLQNASKEWIKNAVNEI